MDDEPGSATPKEDEQLTGWRGLREAFRSAVVGLSQLFSALLEPFRYWR
ncbi:MAG TPA: hypothetical protein VNY35_07450 [Solirubrobacteraceae bacterium]|jgi:hypothetical protein|nr:hypothetical protein [Solirubrobacteraceae bacterium]